MREDRLIAKSIVLNCVEIGSVDPLLWLSHIFTALQSIKLSRMLVKEEGTKLFGTITGLNSVKSN